MMKEVIRSLLTMLMIGFPIAALTATGAPPPDGQPRRIAAGQKGSWSPDGKRLAISLLPSTTGVVIHDLTTGKQSMLVKGGKDPAWRPGAEQIAYVRKRGQPEEIWLIDADGNNDRKLADGGYPSWTRDGKKIVFHSRREKAVKMIDLSAAVPEEKTIVENPEGWYPAVSPDGKRLAIQVSDENFGIVDVATGKVEKYGFPGGKSRGFLPGWSPASDVMAFGSYGYGDQVGLWALNVETGRLRQLASGDLTTPEWSPDGRELVYDLRSRPDPSVYVAPSTHFGLDTAVEPQAGGDGAGSGGPGSGSGGAIEECP